MFQARRSVAGPNGGEHQWHDKQQPRRFSRQSQPSRQQKKQRRKEKQQASQKIIRRVQIDDAEAAGAHQHGRVQRDKKDLRREPVQSRQFAEGAEHAEKNLSKVGEEEIDCGSTIVQNTMPPISKRIESQCSRTQQNGSQRIITQKPKQWILPRTVAPCATPFLLRGNGEADVATRDVPIARQHLPVDLVFSVGQVAATAFNSEGLALRSICNATGLPRCIRQLHRATAGLNPGIVVQRDVHLMTAHTA